jgi:hypothetical protein
MSLFDRVWTTCPYCNSKLEFQSHSGDSGLTKERINKCE